MFAKTLASSTAFENAELHFDEGFYVELSGGTVSCNFLHILKIRDLRSIDPLCSGCLKLVWLETVRLEFPSQTPTPLR